MKASDMLKAKAMEMMRESLPYFEKAAEVNGEDIDNLRTLRSVYYKLGNTTKYDEVNARIKSL